MERSLSSVFNRRTQSQGQDTQFSTQSFNTYLTVYSINLAHRFPDVTELDSIDYEGVRNVAKFSAACSSIAVDTWDELSNDMQRRQRSSQAA